MNDAFSHITGHNPASFSGLGVLWGKSTDKARPPRSIPWTPYVHPFASSCHMRSFRACTCVYVCVRALTFAYSCLQAQLKKLQLYMSRSVDAGFER